MKQEIVQIEIRAIKRSQINFAPYNPKKHTEAAVKQQLRNLRNVGYLGGIVWNELTHNLVSGHKRVMAFDLHYKYDGSEQTDYEIKAGVVSMDEKQEKEQNIYMDAHGTNTEQDYDLLAQILPDIDYKNAGLSEEDLQLIGIDFELQTDAERSIAEDLNEIYSPIKEDKEQKKQAVKEAKKKVLDEAEEKFKNMESYVILNFDTAKAKETFLRRFGYNKREKFLKGELFSEMIERVE